MDSAVSSSVDQSARSGSLGPSLPYSFTDLKHDRIDKHDSSNNDYNNYNERRDHKDANVDSVKPDTVVRDTHKQDSIIKVDVSSLQAMHFENVKDIREKVDQIFAPQNVKMICKRAERVYANGYCVFVLYCNR